MYINPTSLDSLYLILAWKKHDEFKDYFDRGYEYNERLKFVNYVSSVNEFFKEFNIGWQINNDSILIRRDDVGLREKIISIGKEIECNSPQAKMHLEKAERFAFQRPLDPENSIKESICAIESIGKSIYPSAITLSDIIKIKARIKIT